MVSNHANEANINFMQHPHKPPMFDGFNPYSIFALIAAATIVVALLINFMLWMYGKASGTEIAQCSDIRYESVMPVPEANMILAFDKDKRLCSYLHRESKWIIVPLEPVQSQMPQAAVVPSASSTAP